MTCNICRKSLPEHITGHWDSSWRRSWYYMWSGNSIMQNNRNKIECIVHRGWYGPVHNRLAYLLHMLKVEPNDR
jgi:hypothetical protein